MAFIAPRIWVDYRPIKIGWVLSDPCAQQLATAVEQSTCLWGGIYNPILPAYSPDYARGLINNLNVDILYGISDSEETANLLSEFPHLAPGWKTRDALQRDSSMFVDVYHPLRKIADNFRGRDKPKTPKVGLPDWHPEDPLSLLWLTLFGKYPKETGKFDYRNHYKDVLDAEEILLRADVALSPEELTIASPIWLSRHGLKIRHQRKRENRNILVGDSTDVHSLLQYWNVRASGEKVEFYDPNHSDRLYTAMSSFIDDCARPVDDKSEEDRVRPLTLWTLDDIRPHGLDISKVPHAVEQGPERIQFLQPTTCPSLRFLDTHQDVVTTVQEVYETPTIDFPIQGTPFFNDHSDLRQQLYVSLVSFLSHGSQTSDWTLNVPHIPLMNEFFGRNIWSDYSGVRVEEGTIGEPALSLFTDVGDQRVTVYPFKIQDFLQEFFNLFKIDRVWPSENGHICTRLIRQMGGVQSCRVFKIRGVRDLIRKYGPEQSFTRSAAQMVIGNVDTTSNKPRFSDYEDLYIEARKHERLTPDDAFEYLLKKEVFRAGLEIKCPSCALGSWAHIDDLRTHMGCPLCGHKFNLTTQLQHKGDWRFRRSGLFGKEDNLGGSIPVALTLQQLDTTLHDDLLFYATSLNFSSKVNMILDCEVDFLAFCGGRGWQDDPKLQIVLGECKSDGGEIEDDDIAKMRKLSDAVPDDVASTYVMFSKTGTFSEDELRRIMSLNVEYVNRAIIWSTDQLEPYSPYEKDKGKLDTRQYVSSLSDLADATASLYFAPLRDEGE